MNKLKNKQTKKQFKKNIKNTKKNIKKTKKKFKILSCNPLVENTIHKNTCYDKKNINKLKNLWNLRHPTIKITENDPIKIWSFFKNIFNNVCNNEQCWLNQEFTKNNIDNNITNYVFAPKAPASWKTNKNEWLSNYDIMSVMSNYEKKHNYFRFIGPTPIDFDLIKNNKQCVWNELCNFDLSYYNNKKINKIGIIFNTDPHDKSGKHWISLFINLNPKHEKPYIFFFDSVGDKPPKEIRILIERIINMSKKINIELDVIDNYKISHQQSSSECGMYCLYFILKLLYNKPTSYFLDKENLITDKKVELYREKYFNII